VKIVEEYLKAVKLYRDYSDANYDPQYSEVISHSHLITLLKIAFCRNLSYEGFLS